MQQAYAPKILLAGLCLYPGLALAQVTDSPFVAVGQVPQICAVQLPELLADRPIVNVEGFGGNGLLIAQLTDPDTLSTNAASFGVGFEAVCNYPHVLTVESQNNGLWRDPGAQVPIGFADGVSYTVTLTWGDETALVRADASARRINQTFITIDRPTEGQIALYVEILPGATNSQAFAPLLAGIYRDTIRVTVAPQ